MKIEIKQVIDQLTDTLAETLEENQKVAALFDGVDIIGWAIVNVAEDGTLTPINEERFDNLRELFKYYNLID